MILKANEKRPATHLSGREMSLKIVQRGQSIVHIAPFRDEDANVGYHLKYDTGLRDANNKYIRI